jgi:GDP-L-fucose synthase
MDKAGRIFVAGHKGLVGSAIVRQLLREGYNNLIVRDRAELDLTRQADVERFFQSERPEYVFGAAALVGGILANQQFPADFIRQNLLVQTNLIDSAWRYGVRKLAFLGSSCIYPKLAPQPIKEEYLLTGALEPTNEQYAIAKIAGIRMAQAYRKQYGFRTISLMPTNLYGPGDNFSLETSNVIPALIRRFHEAKICNAPELVVWGSGQPRREFLHVDDLACAALWLMLHYDEGEIVNIGTGEDVTIREVAETIASITEYRGHIRFDLSKPDGTPRKLLDVSRAHTLGWRARIGLEEGIRQTYQWYVENPQARARELEAKPA